MNRIDGATLGDVVTATDGDGRLSGVLGEKQLCLGLPRVGVRRSSSAAATSIGSLLEVGRLVALGTVKGLLNSQKLIGFQWFKLAYTG